MFLSFSRRHADGVALVVLALICALVFWPLWHGKSYYLGDIQLYFQPMATQWKAALDRGVIPLWNNAILGGAPFVGNPQMWVLYPASLLFLVFPAVQALALTTLLHFWLAGAFFYGWMRRGQFKLHPVAALLGACVWMLCGFVVAKTQFPNMFMAIAWIPAVMWASEAVIKRADARSMLVLALVLGLQMATAHAQISLYTFYMMGVYAVYLWRTTPHEIASKHGNGWRVAALFVGALVLMGLLTLGQTLPVVETIQAAVRQRLGVHAASRFVLFPWTVIVLILPYFYGNPMTDSWHYPRQVNIWESVCYVGLVPLVLAGLAVWRAPQKRARFWLGWSLIYFWISMGFSGGLYILVFKLLPGMNRFHDPARFLSGFSLGAAVLAALGAHWLYQSARRGRLWTTLALGLTVLNLGVFARNFYPFLPRATIETPPPALWGQDALIANRQARLWQPDQGKVWDSLQKYDKWRVGDAENTRRLYESGLYNRHILSGWMTESGYEPLFDRAMAQRLIDLSWNGENQPFDPRLAGELGRNSIRSLQLFRANPIPPTPDLKLVYTSPWQADGRRLYFYRNEKCLPRARFQSDTQTWQMARIVHEDTRSIELEVPSSAQTVELADSLRPGWSATIDGKPLRIERTTQGWRRLRLSPATAATAPTSAARRVHFEYAPMPWKLGIFVSLCALGLVSAGLVATRNRKVC